ATALVTTGGTREILSRDRSLPKGEVENTKWELEVDHEVFQGSLVDWEHFLYDPVAFCCL
uniref:Uncharacterized protein n=1 Tax=Oryctolagus cuniculus TaxID=9986 RepID=A0A5F9CJR7_RABIT